MECKNLIKINHTAYMIDSNDYKLDIEDDREVNKYEKIQKNEVINMVNNFLRTQDKKFDKFISSIEELVEKYNIDYFMVGDGKEVSIDSVAILYHLKNRNSCVDCILKVFYNDGRYSHDDRVHYMIEFSSGASGDNFGFSFYNYFNERNFYRVKDMLEQYFSSDDNGNGDAYVVKKCVNNIQDRINYYYSK